VVLTEGLNGPDERCKLAGDEGRAAGTAALVEEDDAGHLRASGHHGSTRGALVKVLRGLGGSGDCQRRGNKAVEHFIGDGPWWKSGHGKGRVEGRSFGKLPGGEAELLRVLARAGVHQSDGCTAAQRLGAAEQNGAAALGFGAAAG
jgi:hypothetical protein